MRTRIVPVASKASDITLDIELLTRLTIVPREYLEPLMPSESRNLLREEAAEIVDTYLRRLTRREALARLTVGRIAAAFLRRSAHNQLSFARVSDYTRERLGLSASEFYELARVARELSALPLIAAAFERGEIGWTKLREVTAVARSDTQAEWLELARRYTADGLKIIARRMKAAGAGCNSAAGGNVSGVNTDDLDAFARRSVRAAVDEARREAGCDLPRVSIGRHDSASLVDVPDAVDRTSRRDPPTTTNLAALDEEVVDGEPAAVFRLRCPRRVWRLWHRARELARRVEGSDLSDWQAVEAIAAESLSDAGCASGLTSGEHPGAGYVAGETIEAAVAQSTGRYRAAMMSTSFFQEPRDGEDCPWGEDCDEIDVLRWHLPLDAVDEPLPDALVRIGEDAYGTDAHALDRRMRTVLAAIQLLDAQMGALLRTCFGLSLYLDHGYRSGGAYVRNRLGMCSRKARGLVALERKSLTVAPQLMRAYREGRLSWYRALMLLPIISESNAEAWIERACSVTARRLRDELDWALEIHGNAPLTTVVMPPAPDDPLTTRPCSTCGVEHDRREFSRAAGPPDSAGELCGTGSDSGYTSRTGADERQIGGHAGAPCIALAYPTEALANVEIRIRGPMSVISLLCEALEARRECAEPAWCAFERVLVHAVEYWESGPKHRDPIFARDGWRCAAPCCSSRRNLHDHHILFRSQQGGDEHDNRIAICAWHHLRGIHAGTIRVAGLVSKGLVWEMGVCPGKPPLIRCAGEQYREPDDEGHMLEAIDHDEEQVRKIAAVA